MTGADPNADATAYGRHDPQVGRAPASFRAFLELTARNWAEGVLEVVTPDGERLDIKGPQEGPARRPDHPQLRLREAGLFRRRRGIRRGLDGGRVGHARPVAAAGGLQPQLRPPARRWWTATPGPRRSTG